MLLAPGLFLQQVMTQQADAPVAFFLVSALAVMRSANTHAYVLAGALVGLAAWTKNEGLLFAAAMAPVILWMAIRQWSARPVVWWLAGLAPVVATIAWFKTYIAPVPAPYFEEPQTVASIVARIAGPERHAIIVPLVAQGAMAWGGARAAGAAVLALAAGTVASVRDSEARRALAILGFVAIGYYGVYLLSPLDTAWLVRTTFYRMVTQVWPAVVLAAFGSQGREKA